MSDNKETYQIRLSNPEKKYQFKLDNTFFFVSLEEAEHSLKILEKEFFFLGEGDLEVVKVEVEDIESLSE